MGGLASNRHTLGLSKSCRVLAYSMHTAIKFSLKDGESVLCARNLASFTIAPPWRNCVQQGLRATLDG
jgi:hypothetical protein